MHVRPDNPLIVQGDGKVLVETRHTRYEEARDFLSRFAELEASPEHLHTYRIGPLSLWNAAATGMTFEEITTRLRELSKFDIPPNVLETEPITSPWVPIPSSPRSCCAWPSRRAMSPSW